MNLLFTVVDVFTNQPFAGNPLAIVYHEAEESFNVRRHRRGQLHATPTATPPSSDLPSPRAIQEMLQELENVVLIVAQELPPHPPALISKHGHRVGTPTKASQDLTVSSKQRAHHAGASFTRTTARIVIHDPVQHCRRPHQDLRHAVQVARIAHVPHTPQRHVLRRFP